MANENHTAAVAEATYLAMRELRRYGYSARLVEHDQGGDLGLLAVTTPNGTSLTLAVSVPE